MGQNNLEENKWGDHGYQSNTGAWKFPTFINILKDYENLI